VLRFELACLRELGLMPALDRCAHCGTLVGTAGEVAFGLSSGGVICRDCRPGQPHVAMISSKTLAAIQTLASPGRAWRDLADESPKSSLAAAHKLVEAVISHVLGHRPKVWPYLGV
jgi:DNA repair protein RecO (recombination protein O)